MDTFDYHLHSQYSDGTAMVEMVRAASEAGLDGVGFADHCNLTSEEMRKDREYYLHETYGSRRTRIADLEDDFDVEIFDAVEVDYYPYDEVRIGRFLDEAGFEYAIGSVHYLRDRHLSDGEFFGDLPREERARLVDEYVDRVVRLIESNLFDIVAHLDFPDRYPPFRDLLTETHYSALGDALVRSNTVPEINVGRLFGDYGKTHPGAEFLDYLSDRGVTFAFGTDAHRPRTLRRGAEYYQDVLADSEITFVSLD